jgi:hypothetical protein
MNERIKQLAEQARDWGYAEHSGYTAQLLFEQKFAELIVRECFDVVINDGRFHDAKGIIRAGKSVAMEHFGVEE